MAQNDSNLGRKIYTKWYFSTKRLYAHVIACAFAIGLCIYDPDLVLFAIEEAQFLALMTILCWLLSLNSCFTRLIFGDAMLKLQVGVFTTKKIHTSDIIRVERIKAPNISSGIMFTYRGNMKNQKIGLACEDTEAIFAIIREKFPYVLIEN